jgi:hypothetical protein
MLLLLMLLLQQANSRVSTDYLAAFRRLIVDMESTVADCQFSLEGMVGDAIIEAMMLLLLLLLSCIVRCQFVKWCVARVKHLMLLLSCIVHCK